MWIFFSVMAICITVIVWKYIDEACDIDWWRLEKKFDKIIELLKAGGKHE